MKDPAAVLYERLLVLRCQGGDEAALTELIGRYSPGLRLFLRKIIGQDATADDLLQETWLSVYRKVAALQRADAFAAWIYRIARDKAYHELRRQRRLPTNDIVDDAISSSLAADWIEDKSDEEDAQRVRAALDDLPLEQREVLVLRFVEDMSYEEIADVIARPVGTVRSRIHYAKRALRAVLDAGKTRKEATP